MLAIDQYAYRSPLRGIHPGEKLLFSLTTILVVLLFNTPPVSLLVLLGISFFLVAGAKIPLKFYGKLLMLPAAFLLLGVLTVAFSWSAQPSDFLLSWRAGELQFGVTVSGADAAFRLFMKSLAAVSCLYFLILTTPMVEIFSLCYRWHLPGIVVEMMSLIYRFLFLLLETAGAMMTSQHSRWGYASLPASFRSLSALVGRVFLKSYHQALAAYDAMESRCYQGEFRILDWDYRLSWRNIALITAVEINLCLIYYLGGLWQ